MAVNDRLTNSNLEISVFYIIICSEKLQNMCEYLKLAFF